MNPQKESNLENEIFEAIYFTLKSKNYRRSIHALDGDLNYLGYEIVCSATEKVMNILRKDGNHD